MILKQTQKNRKFDQWLKRIIELKLLVFFQNRRKKKRNSIQHVFCCRSSVTLTRVMEDI